MSAVSPAAVDAERVGYPPLAAGRSIRPSLMPEFETLPVGAALNPLSPVAAGLAGSRA
jgi:hypothetical protein